jgi:hypothetical protein
VLGANDAEMNRTQSLPSYLEAYTLAMEKGKSTVTTHRCCGDEQMELSYRDTRAISKL